MTAPSVGHTSLAAGRWRTLTPMAQLGNIGSEVEVLRAREQFCRVFYDDTAEPDLADYLREYFLQFAVAARRASGR